MTEHLKQKLNDSAVLRWSVLALVAFTMLCGYFLTDVMSPLKPMLEKELLWDSLDYGFFTSAYGWFNVFLLMLIFGGIILDKMGVRFTGMGAYALVFGNVTYPLVVCFLNGRSVSRNLGFKQEVVKTFCVPFLSSVVMGILTFVVYELFFIVSHRIYVAIVPALVVAVASYFALVLKLQGLSRSELYEFPMGRKMSIVADKFHLLND